MAFTSRIASNGSFVSVEFPNWREHLGGVENSLLLAEQFFTSGEANIESSFSPTPILTSTIKLLLDLQSRNSMGSIYLKEYNA